MSPFVALTLSLVWIAGAALMVFRIRLPRPLAKDIRDQPSVSVVIPARNEARSIERCVESICASEYPDFEVIVLDDQSEDDTGALAGALDAGRAQRVVVKEGAPLPTGWLGKPWACQQGSELAGGELILFTDADTWHHPDLLKRAVSSLQEDHADVVTVVGRQEMGTFWEKLVMPQVFFGMMQVFPDIRRGFRRERWRRSVANGQYMLFRRDAYQKLGGHGVVKESVVEDLRMAQILTRDGYALTVRHGDDVLSTRMYHSLRELIAGWSKNTAMGARHVAGNRGGVVMLLMSLIAAPIVWLLPPTVALWSLVGNVGTPLLAWAVCAYGVGVLLWGAVSRFLGVSVLYGFLYPLGVAMTWYITARSSLRGTRVEWKGRRYVLGTPE